MGMQSWDNRYGLLDLKQSINQSINQCPWVFVTSGCLYERLCERERFEFVRGKKIQLRLNTIIIIIIIIIVIYWLCRSAQVFIQVGELIAQFSPASTVFFTGSFQIGLRFQCLRVSFKVTSKAIPQQGLRIALGAFRASPVQSLYVEAHEPSLSSRRLKLSLNYVMKLNSCPNNPAYSCIFELQNAKLFEKSQFVTPPLGWIDR